MRRSYDSCISNEIIHKYFEDISSAPNPEQNSGAILSDRICPYGSFISSGILIKREDEILNEFIGTIKCHQTLLVPTLINIFSIITSFTLYGLQSIHRTLIR